MLPPVTTWPPKRLMPSRCPCESRPFTEEPPPFLCAIRKSSVQLYVADFHRGERLAMPARDFVLPTALVLQDETLVAAPMRNDFAGHFGFPRRRTGHDFLAVIVDRQHLIERHFAADFSVELFDANRLSRRDAILLTPTANHGVHEPSKAFAETLIIRALQFSDKCPVTSSQGPPTKLVPNDPFWRNCEENGELLSGQRSVGWRPLFLAYRYLVPQCV